MRLCLGTRRFDLTERPVVVGILNRTRDSFHDRGDLFPLDRLLARAERLAAEGADVLEVGARPGGGGAAEGTPEEERDLAAETVAALRSRFDLPLAVDSTRAVVAAAAFDEGAVLGNDMSGFRDPGSLPTAAAAGAAVVATHIRRPPGVPDADPVYADLLGEGRGRLARVRPAPPGPRVRRPSGRGARAGRAARRGRPGRRGRPRARRRRPGDRPGQVLAAVA